MAKWDGPVCCMCGGTGMDFTYSEVTENGRVHAIRNVPTGHRCRLCNGHGREPSDDSTPITSLRRHSP